MTQLYAISDDVLTPSDTIISQTKKILNCGVKFFQYRCKQQKDKKIAKELLRICNDHDAIFIINDDVEFAAEVGTNAVHIGKNDCSIEYAKKILGNEAFIGVSCYDDFDLALKAQEDGASYVAFGAVFQSSTKPNAPLCKLQTLKLAKEILKIPICAIGGINSQNIGILSDIGIDYIAVINAIYKPYSIEQNIKLLKSLIEKKSI